MPWEKNFDVDQALNKAMEAFWANGFEATSMQELVDCMGIGRGSLYATFGDKRSLFIQALRRYDKHYREDWAERLKTTKPPREAILSAFEEVMACVFEDGRSEGCLLVNTALELSPHDEEVSAIVENCFESMEQFFREQLEQAQAIGDVPSDLSPDQTAKTLLSLIVSLRVFSRSRRDPALFKSIAKQAEALIS